MSEEILKAKKEVGERVRQLADDELEKVAGGRSGDTRIGMDEGMADIDGLTADVDGFDA